MWNVTEKDIKREIAGVVKIEYSTNRIDVYTKHDVTSLSRLQTLKKFFLADDVEITTRADKQGGFVYAFKGQIMGNKPETNIYLDHLRSGRIITITDPAHKYEPATFCYCNGMIYSFNDEVGICEQTAMTNNPDLLEKHMRDMILKYKFKVCFSNKKCPHIEESKQYKIA